MTNIESISLIKGRELLKEIAPDTEEVLKSRYDDLLPNFSESVIDISYGQVYSREGLDFFLLSGR